MDEFAQADYYAAIAQVIPVLFVLVAVEPRVVDVSELKPSDPRWFIGALVVVTIGLAASGIMGEAAALRVLAERRELEGADFLIVSSLVSAAGTLLLVPLLAILYQTTTTEIRARGVGRLTRLALLGLLGLAIVGAPAASAVVAIVAAF